jgi:hypothetical protein
MDVERAIEKLTQIVEGQQKILQGHSVILQDLTAIVKQRKIATNNPQDFHMDTTLALKKLFAIAKSQQEVLKKLAQGVPPVAPAPVAPATDPRSQQLMTTLTQKNPGIERLFITLPQVLTTDGGGKPVIDYTYKMSQNDAALKQALNDAATEVFGANAFLLQGHGQTAPQGQR